MNRLTKFTLAATAVSLICSLPVFADGTIYGTGFLLSVKQGSNSLTNEIYQANTGGGSDYGPDYSGGSTNGVNWTPATLTVNAYDYSGDVAAGTLNLGTFNVATSDVLTLDGGEVLAWTHDSPGYTTGDLYYSIDGGSFTQLSLPENQGDFNGDDFRDYLDTANVNLLSSLANGSHTLTVKFDGNDNYGSGTFSPTDNNGGGGYVTSFSVIPEPSTIMLMLSSGLFGSFYLLRRKRK